MKNGNALKCCCKKTINNVPFFSGHRSGVEFNAGCNARTPSFSATHALQHDYGFTGSTTKTHGTIRTKENHNYETRGGIKSINCAPSRHPRSITGQQRFQINRNFSTLIVGLTFDLIEEVNKHINRTRREY